MLRVELTVGAALATLLSLYLSMPASAQEPSPEALTPPSAATLPDGDATPAPTPSVGDSYRPTEQELDPALPAGMSLDEVLARAAETPPPRYPDAINDDRMLFFFLWDQLEYRIDGKDAPDQLGWEANVWFGGDFNRLVIKPEGEAVLEDGRSVESETDVMYSRLVAPFWSLQAGAQYANEWQQGADYSDSWSAALAIQGLAPGKFEVDATGYVSEDGDFTSQLELEYDWRITQRFVAQPRAELTVAFQDIAERNVGAGLSEVVTGLRFRYEFMRELAPYLGVRYAARVFESADRSRSAGVDPTRFFVVGGLRAAFL